MKRLSAFLMLLPLLAVQAAAAPHGSPARQQQQEQQQQQEFPPPTPLDDPYVPPAGDPDVFAPQQDDQGEAPSPLNPAGN
jgi:hypothetical protein